MNKSTRYLFSFILILGFVSVILNAQEPKVKLGMWEWSMTMEMPGMSFNMSPITYESCLTKQDLIPQQTDPSQQCKMLHNKVTSSGVEWKVECTSEAGKSHSNGKVLYKYTTAKGKIEVLTNGMTMITKIKGHRIGACK